MTAKWITVLALLSASPAFAEVGIDTTGSGYGVSGSKAVQTVREASGNEQAAEPSYIYVPVCEIGGVETCQGFSECEGSGTAHSVYLPTAGGRRGDLVGTTCIGGDGQVAPAPPRITDEMVLNAFRRVEVPKPVLVVQPPGGKTLVNLETIFSTSAEPFNRTVRLLGRAVELAITPSGFTWRHGDGTSQTTKHPGRAYRRGAPVDGYVTHTYTRASKTVRLNVEVTYSARFRVDGGVWRDVAGTVSVSGGEQVLSVLPAEPALVNR